MSTPTAARTQGRTESHWYDREGNPRYEMLGKSTGRLRPTTIRDARENDWLPSVTTILKVLHKQALVDWLIEQSCLAVLTTPRRDGETLDAFVERVLHVEKVQDQEAQAARDMGIAIHEGIAVALAGGVVNGELVKYVEPAVGQILATGRVVATEKIVVGAGYAGKLDAMTESPGTITVWDVKTTKNLPKYGSYDEHKLQLGAYAQAIGNTGNNRIVTANLYVSTREPGQIKVDNHGENWQAVYEHGFRPLVDYWSWVNDYEP